MGCVYVPGELRNDAMWQKLPFCHLFLLCGLFTKCMPLISQALVLYSNLSLWNSKNNISPFKKFSYFLSFLEKNTWLISITSAIASKQLGCCEFTKSMQQFIRVQAAFLESSIYLTCSHENQTAA